MTSKKDTIVILYGAGTYGNFIEWCLNYFSGEDVSKDFNYSTNNKFKGNYFLDIKEWRNYIHSDTNFKFSRLHPKRKITDLFGSGSFGTFSVVDVTEEVLLSINKAILLYHDNTSTLLAINNKFDKTFEDKWLEKTVSSFDFHFKQWNKNDLEHMNKWELREFLSFFIFKQHENECQNLEIKKYINENVKKVNINDLFDNFENTIKDLLLWSGLDLVRNNFEEIHRIWVKLQNHRHKDKLVKKIINSIIKEKHFDWSNQSLSVVDEAFIQMSLRDLHKQDLRCYNLNVFPTNTKDLKELLFDA